MSGLKITSGRATPVAVLMNVYKREARTWSCYVVDNMNVWHGYTCCYAEDQLAQQLQNDPRRLTYI